MNTTHLKCVSKERSTHVCRFAGERTFGRCAVATVLLSVNCCPHCKNRNGIEWMRAPPLPLCATPHTYCLLGFDWAPVVRYPAPVTSTTSPPAIVNTYCHTALHQSTDTDHRHVCVRIHCVPRCVCQVQCSQHLSPPRGGPPSSLP